MNQHASISNCMRNRGTFLMANMKLLNLLFLFTASSHALVPVHGCEKTPDTTAITNFTLFHNATTGSTSDYVKWQVPALTVSCSSSTGGMTAIGQPGVNTFVPCNMDGTKLENGRILLAADSGIDSVAKIGFSIWAQCAASRFEFYYEGSFLLSCATDVSGSATCVPKGNATTTYTGARHILPMPPPPPPPFQFPQPSPTRAG